jgi:dihydroxy-acid dehydratase
MCIGYAGPEAAYGGPIGLLRDGDVVAIDARPEAASITVELDEAELERRRNEPVPQRAPTKGGVLEKYAAVVGPARWGAVTHSGAVDWPEEPESAL